ncbi:MAG: TetR/AcrR family transcriptional regulator [Faecousia sp.]
MEQKTDLRIQKTEKAIREAFLDIRRRLPLEKVKVRDICQRAMINTSTFYNHYRDVQDLSDQLENGLLERCVSTIPDLDCLFTDPYRFLTELRRCFSESEHSAALAILFDGRLETLHQKIDRLLRRRYQSAAGTESDYIKVSFVLGGVMYTGQLMQENKALSVDATYRSLAELIRRLHSENR